MVKMLQIVERSRSAKRLPQTVIAIAVQLLLLLPAIQLSPLSVHLSPVSVSVSVLTYSAGPSGVPTGGDGVGGGVGGSEHPTQGAKGSPPSSQPG